MRPHTKILSILQSLVIPLCVLGCGCERAKDQAPSSIEPVGMSRSVEAGLPVSVPTRFDILGMREVEDLPLQIAQFETVFWEPADTRSLRQLIREAALVEGKRVLEVGTGTGLIALSCLQRGAAHVVATDINPAAVANAAYNAQRLQLADRLDVRQVSVKDPSAYSVVADEERFDLILSNPPWEDDQPRSIDQYALYDQDFALLESLLAGADRHLAPGGRMLLAYGCVDAIRRIEQLAPQYGLTVQRLDDRALDELSDVFLPGMLLELRRQAEGGGQR